MQPLFDPSSRVLCRNRAAVTGPELFLANRAFDDILDRLASVNRAFSNAMLIGCPDPRYAEGLTQIVTSLTIIEPSPVFAARIDATCIEEGDFGFQPESHDLIVAFGTLDTVNDLPEMLLKLRFALKPDGLLIGVLAGGDSLALLRRCMTAADAAMGTGSVPHAHPRIDPAGLTTMLDQAGFAMPVVDVDRVTVRYSALDRLVADLRAMGATNILTQRPRQPVLRQGLTAARGLFAHLSEPDGKSAETFDLLHFAAWAPPAA